MAYIFVEGSDDQRLLNIILDYYGKNAKIIEYINKDKNTVDNFFKTLSPDKYYILADLDYKKSKDDVIRALKKKYPHVSEKRVIVVKMEIESWYIAGVNDKNRVLFKYKLIPECTEELCKEKVYEIIKNGKKRDIVTELIRIG